MTIKSCQHFNNFFANVVTNLNIKMDDDHLYDTENLTDNVNIVIKRYKNHPSIISRLIKFSFN